MMFKTQKKHSLLITSLCLLALTALPLVAFSSCSDDDEPNRPVITDPNAQWSPTLKGNGEVLGAYPDLFSNYWQYTYNIADNSNMALCFRGSFPHARYFSFSIYNDENGTVVGGINDVEMTPDAGSVNPFLTTSTADNKFTVYIVPPTMTEAQIAKLPSKNIIRVSEGIKRVAVCVREYLGNDGNGNGDEHGGVKLPAITAVDINTLKETVAPERVASNIDKMKSDGYTQRSDDFRDVPFFLAPKGSYYPNNSTSYLYARTRIADDSVLTFSFIPVTIPQKVEEYTTAPARYWSICLGSAVDTRSYNSIYDRVANYAEGQKTNFIIVMQQNPRLAEVKAKVDELNKAGGHWNLMVWNREKVNVDGKAIGNVVVVMYRNILPDRNWPHSISQMTPTNYKDETGEPIDHVTDPSKQIASQALGDYGPQGTKYATAQFLSNN